MPVGTGRYSYFAVNARVAGLDTQRRTESTVVDATDAITAAPPKVASEFIAEAISSSP